MICSKDRSPFYRRSALTILSALTSLTVGCGTLKTRFDRAEAVPTKGDHAIVSPRTDGVVATSVTATSIDDDTEVLIASSLKAAPLEPMAAAGHEEVSPPKVQVEKRLKIPVEMNSYVDKWVTYFSTKDRERFQRFLNRGQQYREVVESVLEESDLPAELYYLAMIESGYQTHANSHAQAVGVWQFIAGTGSRYGLRIDKHVDERRDPIRSSEAAAKYLRDLYNVFGSWHLAMAAYNAGEIRILRAVMKGRTRNFWELVRMGALPVETADYVPKFLAVVVIGQNPEKYGFKIAPDNEKYPDLEAVEVPGSIPLRVIAQKSGIPLDVLKKVNPHLLDEATPVSAAYEVWVPTGSAKTVTSFQPELKTLAKQYRSIASLAQQQKTSPFHIVKNGENLSSIASKYNVSVGHLMRINDLKSTRLLVGSKLRTQARSYRISNTVRYKVRRGDNLAIIARRFKTSAAKIKASNQMKKSRIFVGQILEIVRNN